MKNLFNKKIIYILVAFAVALTAGYFFLNKNQDPSVFVIDDPKFTIKVVGPTNPTVNTDQTYSIKVSDVVPGTAYSAITFVVSIPTSTFDYVGSTFNIVRPNNGNPSPYQTDFSGGSDYRLSGAIFSSGGFTLTNNQTIATFVVKPKDNGNLSILRSQAASNANPSVEYNVTLADSLAVAVQQPAVNKPRITSITTSKTSYTQGEDVIVTIVAEGYGTTITSYSVYNSNATSISNPLSASQGNTVTLRGLAPGNYSIKAVVEDSNDVFSDFSETTNFTVTQNNGGVQTVQNPVFSPADQNVTTSTQVTLTSDTEGANIYYCIANNRTTCNPRPSQTGSRTYSGAFTLPAGNKTVYAIARKSDMTNSAVVNKYYVVSSGGGTGGIDGPGPNDNTPVAGNLLNNWNFENNTASWSYALGGAIFTVTPNKVAKITVGTPANNMQLMNRGFELKENHRYQLKFLASASRNRTIRADILKNTANASDNYPNFGLNKTFDITTSQQEYSTEFVATGFTGTTTDTRFRFWFGRGMNSINGDIIYLDNISLVDLGTDNQPQTVSTPTFSPVGSSNNLTAPVSVTISTSTSGATIYYCRVENTGANTNCTPTTQYSSPVVLQAGEWLIKAKAIKSEMTDSTIATANYVVQSPAPQTYKACENNQCVQKTGVGTDSCTTNVDCANTTPLRDPVFTNLYTYLLPNEEIGINSDGNSEQVEAFYCIDIQASTSGLGVACTPNIKYIADAGLYMPGDKGSWVTIRSQSKSTESSRVSSIVNKQYKLLGDITEDGEYNILDIIEMIKVVFNGQVLQDQDIADMNRDDQINILDVIEIIKLVFNS